MYTPLHLKNALQLDKLSTKITLHHIFHNDTFMISSRTRGHGPLPAIQSLTGLVQLHNKRFHGYITKEFVPSVNSIKILK